MEERNIRRKIARTDVVIGGMITLSALLYLPEKAIFNIAGLLFLIIGVTILIFSHILNSDHCDESIRSDLRAAESYALILVTLLVSGFLAVYLMLEAFRFSIPVTIIRSFGLFCIGIGFIYSAYRLVKMEEKDK